MSENNATQAMSSQGTKFYRKDTAEGTYAKIAEITGISGPDKSRETIQVTSLEHEDGYHRFISGFKDGGSVSLEMNYTFDTYDTMNDDFEDDDNKFYKIELKNGDKFEFEGLVTNLPLGISVGDRITANTTIQVSGKVDATEGTGGTA